MPDTKLVTWVLQQRAERQWALFAHAGDLRVQMTGWVDTPTAALRDVMSIHFEGEPPPPPEEP
jgi:hypothetical protein